MKVSFLGQGLGHPTNQNPAELVKLTALISKLTRSHQYSEALRLFDHLYSSHHLKPSTHTLASTLTACANLRHLAAGKQLHAHVVRAGFQQHACICNTLILFYAKSSNFDSMHKVFDEIPKPDAYTWSTIVSAYTKSGQIDHARQLFDKIPQKGTAVWNAMITGCAECGFPGVAFQLFVKMHQSGVWPDNYTFASVLSLCSSPELLNLGKQVQSIATRTGFLAMDSVINAHVTMYFNCESIEDACAVFDEAKTHNTITFNAMIAGFVSLGRDLQALMVFKEMKQNYFEPTELTFMSVFSACSSKKMVNFGGQVHAQAIRLGFEGFVLVSNAAITMYSNSGDLQKAQLVFERLEDKDLVSWNSMIAAFGQHNCYVPAMVFFLQMQRTGMEPDKCTFVSVLSGLEGSGLPGNVKMIQGLVTKNGFILDIQVCNALVCAYVKYGKVEYAYKMFDEMPDRNLITWNSIISGFLQNGLPTKALELFQELQTSKLESDSLTLSIVLSSCSSLSALKHGKQVHAHIIRSASQSDVLLNNALLSMYAKCGVLTSSSKLFDKMPERNLVSWNSMIAAYGQHGEGKEAIHCFKKLQELGIELDPVTFMAILSACSHAGLVEDGRRIFTSMVEDHGMQPGIEHYSCMIDLLGRAGYLDEVEEWLTRMPVEADSGVWWAVLSACRAYGNVRLGRVAAGFLIEQEPKDPAVYVLLSNIYKAAEQWEDAAGVRELMRKNGVVKKPGCSWID